MENLNNHLTLHRCLTVLDLILLGIGAIITIPIEKAAQLINIGTLAAFILECTGVIYYE